MIKDGEINISEEGWKELNSTFSKDEIKKMISDAIGNNDLPMPMRKISKLDCSKAFQELLSLDTREVIRSGKWFTRYDYNAKYFPVDRLFSNSRIGNLASDYYQQKNRWMCDSINSPSPYRTWNTEKFRLTLLGALWSLKFKSINSQKLRTSIGLRKYIASQFRPSTAKAIYDHYGSKNVLDFSSGWGDRLCGFLASDAESYLGIDPNKNLFDGYAQMVNDLNVNDKKVEMFNSCAEDVVLGSRKFDLVFTSPPYFNVEKYTQEGNQSFKKYRKLKLWLNNFLLRAIETSWSHLETRGHLVINISDVYSNHTINQICDPMNEYISSLRGSKYIGCYGYQMNKRPSSGALKGKAGTFAEPIWVWQKTD